MKRIIPLLLIVLLGCGKAEPPLEQGRFNRHIDPILQGIVEDYEKSDCDYIVIEIHADGFAGVQGKNYPIERKEP